MNWKRPLARAANQILNKQRLLLSRLNRDFDNRLADSKDLDRLFSAFADEFENWFGSQEMVPRPTIDWKAEVSGFYEIYLQSPYRDMFGGSRFNNQLWLYAVTKAYSPSLVIDSGTYQGASAWVLDQAAPGRVVSFDIDLSQLRRREAGVRYVEQDWSNADILRGEDFSRALIYFDDHVDQARRLLEAQAAGVSLAIFDDDFPITSFANMAYDGLALPKIEFLLDDHFLKNPRVRWYQGSQLREFIASPQQVARARAAIGATLRLPNTSLITGVHQTPYRLVEVLPAQQAGR